MKKNIAVLVLGLTMGVMPDVMAQSTDATYPMGVWQTSFEEDGPASELFVNLEVYREKGSSLTISEQMTDKELFSGVLEYTGKELKDGVPTGTYYFDVKSSKGEKCSISINAKRTPMIIGTGVLKDHPAFKDRIVFIPAALSSTGGETHGGYCETEKELLEDLRLALTDRKYPTVGFGNLQQYINAHAKLNPAKPKYAKPKGAGAINIRKEGKATAPVVYKLPAGKSLLVVDEFDGWCQVQLEGKERGWVSLSVVTLTNTEGTPAIEPTYPPIVDGHVSFLGVPIIGTPMEMRDKLMAKGLKKASGTETETGNVYLTGTVNGVPCMIQIHHWIGNKVGGINCVENKSYRLAQAKARAKVLLARMEGIYGKAASTDFDNDMGEATIKVGNGSVVVGYHNEDEMDGASDFYVVTTYFTDSPD